MRNKLCCVQSCRGLARVRPAAFQAGALRTSLSAAFGLLFFSACCGAICWSSYHPDIEIGAISAGVDSMNVWLYLALGALGKGARATA